MTNSNGTGIAVGAELSGSVCEKTYGATTRGPESRGGLVATRKGVGFWSLPGEKAGHGDRETAFRHSFENLGRVGRLQKPCMVYMKEAR